MPTIPPPPGELVDVGGHRVHLQRQGTGTPPVVLEAALGDRSLSWALVQPRVASFTTVYGYDRAGLAWSDTGPNPRTASTMVAELHDLLRAAAVELPIVLAALSDVTLTEAADTPGHVKYVFATEFDKGPVTVTSTLQRDRDQIEGIFMESAG
jgi:hypothetical protein